MKGIAVFGCIGTGLSESGSTRVGVTMIARSLTLLVTSFDWKSLPRIGMSPIPGDFRELIAGPIVEQSGDAEALTAS